MTSWSDYNQSHQCRSNKICFIFFEFEEDGRLGEGNQDEIDEVNTEVQMENVDDQEDTATRTAREETNTKYFGVMAAYSLLGMQMVVTGSSFLKHYL